MALVSLYGATKVDGRYLVNETFLEDCSALNIISVTNCTFPDADGVEVSGFLIKYKSAGLQLEEILMKTHTGLTTIANFGNGLAAAASTVATTIFTDLIGGSDYIPGTVPADTSVLLGDAFIQYAAYDPDNDQTIVLVNSGQRLVATKYIFDGDQTAAGQHQYLTSAGNV